MELIIFLKKFLYDVRFKYKELINILEEENLMIKAKLINLKVILINNS